MLPLRRVGRSNFDKGLHILTTTLIQKRRIIIRTAILYICTCVGIYMCIYIHMYTQHCFFIYCFLSFDSSFILPFVRSLAVNYRTPLSGTEGSGQVETVMQVVGREVNEHGCGANVLVTGLLPGLHYHLTLPLAVPKHRVKKVGEQDCATC